MDQKETVRSLIIKHGGLFIDKFDESSPPPFCLITPDVNSPKYSVGSLVVLHSVVSPHLETPLRVPKHHVALISSRLATTSILTPPYHSCLLLPPPP